MLVEEGFNVVSVDASDKMLKYALKARWERRKEAAFDQWGTVFLLLLNFRLETTKCSSFSYHFTRLHILCSVLCPHRYNNVHVFCRRHYLVVFQRDTNNLKQMLHWVLYSVLNKFIRLPTNQSFMLTVEGSNARVCTIKVCIHEYMYGALKKCLPAS